MNFSLEAMIIRIPAILVALTVHEFAHGWVAYRLGDRTAHQAGRLSFNPLAHLDVLGTVMLLFGPFGWAKPVPVEPGYFRNPKKGILLVSLAGPLSNVVLAIVLGHLYLFLRNSLQLAMDPHIVLFFKMSIAINIGISFFNLLPVPPLDGSKILLGLLPDRYIIPYIQKTRYLPNIFMVLIIAEWGLHIPVLSAVINPLYKPYHALILFFIQGRF